MVTAVKKTGYLKCPTSVGAGKVGRKTDNKSNHFNLFFSNLKFAFFHVRSRKAQETNKQKVFFLTSV